MNWSPYCLGGDDENDSNETMATAAEHSLYPLPGDIEAIGIPTCREAFDAAESKNSYRWNREHFSSRARVNSSKSISSSSSMQQSVSSYSAEASGGGKWSRSYKKDTSYVSMKSGGSSHGSKPGSAVEVPGPAYVPLDRKVAERVPARKEIEVSPGVFLPLHGTQETLDAVQDDAITGAMCFACGESLYCVNCACFVLCPSCRVVSPLESYSYSEKGFDDPSGVGLGITENDYLSLLAER